MKKLKYSILTLAAISILVMMAATVTENFKGSAFVTRHIYGATWFVALWAALACSSLVYIIMKRLHKRKIIFAIHISFLVILTGALISWLTAVSGSIHLRKGETKQKITLTNGGTANMGFKLKLTDFRIDYYPGTDAPMDYISELSDNGETISISMNNIGEHKGYRFTMSAYDDDMKGATLGVLYDPWGIGITYTGYAMLFLSLIATLASNHTRMTALYHKAKGCRVALKTLTICTILTFSGLSTNVNAQERINIDPEVCSNFSRICVLYNNRICPINSVANDFVTKLAGKPTWNNMTASEIFCGWVFDVPYWETVKMIEIKDKEVQHLLGITGKWASFNDFWDEYNEYKLEKPLRQQHNDNKSKIKALREADEKFNIIRMLYNGELLKMFPYRKADRSFEWFAPGTHMGNIKLNDKELRFISKAMDFLAENIITGNKQQALELENKIYNYQHVRAAEVIPTNAHIKCELFYNNLATQRWPIMLFLSLSLLLTIAATMVNRKLSSIADRASLLLLCIMTTYTTVALALRWIVSGHVPMSNGFETMQIMAWGTLLITLLLRKRLPILCQYAPLLASLALLVAMITDSNPQITQLMPVLQSPLLSLHVIVIMFAYALFGLMAITGIQGLICHMKGNTQRTEQLAALTQLLLYPAVALLATGIFIGAIWANVSWGKYWSWDPKETWALITMLIYAAPLHSSIHWLRKPQHQLLYMVAAFLSVLMTYFGVNYFLTGMHSYA